MPPAMARSLAPERRLWIARSTATIEEEQAVSSVRLGPRRPRRYEIAPEAMQWRLPPTICPSSSSMGRDARRCQYSTLHIPTKTPVCVPSRLSGAIPASSIAAQQAAAKRRCCGSMDDAFFGATPEKTGSISVIPSTNAP